MSHIMSKVHVYVTNVGFPQPPSNTRHGMKSSRRRTPPALLLTSLYGLEKQELTLTFHSSCTLETRELFLPLISFYGGDSRPLRLFLCASTATTLVLHTGTARWGRCLHLVVREAKAMVGHRSGSAMVFRMLCHSFRVKLRQLPVPLANGRGVRR